VGLGDDDSDGFGGFAAVSRLSAFFNFATSNLSEWSRVALQHTEAAAAAAGLARKARHCLLI
jgi:hypothetical protein